MNNLVGVISSLSQCSRALISWNKHRKPVNEKVIQEKSKALSKLQGNEGYDNIEEIKVLQKELGSFLENEDLKWKK